MAYSLIDKLTNFLMPLEESETEQDQVSSRVRKASLQVHSPASLRVFIAVPRAESEICHLADCLKNKISLVVNYNEVDLRLQQAIHDFLCGVSYITEGSNERISDRIYMYVPAHAEFDKRLFAVTIPTYVKKKLW